MDKAPEVQGVITISFAGPTRRVSVTVDLDDSFSSADAMRLAIQALETLRTATTFDDA